MILKHVSLSVKESRPGKHMLINKSIYYHKLRQRKQHCTGFATVDPIRDGIAKLNMEIAALQKKMSKHALPSFNARERKTRDIEAHKTAINAKIRELENMVKAVGVSEPRMNLSIQSYFYTLLKRIVVLYRAVQQESLNRSDVYDESQMNDTFYDDEARLQMAMGRASQIRQNIFALTNTLLELKMALKNQSMTIDRIDFFFERSNFYLEEANKEIEQIPGNFTEYKDFIIYCMIYAVAILLILVLIKTAKEPNKR